MGKNMCGKFFFQETIKPLPFKLYIYLVLDITCKRKIQRDIFSDAISFVDFLLNYRCGCKVPGSSLWSSAYESNDVRMFIGLTLLESWLGVYDCCNILPVICTEKNFLKLNNIYMHVKPININYLELNIFVSQFVLHSIQLVYSLVMDLWLTKY